MVEELELDGDFCSGVGGEGVVEEEGTDERVEVNEFLDLYLASTTETIKAPFNLLPFPSFIRLPTYLQRVHGTHACVGAARWTLCVEVSEFSPSPQENPVSHPTIFYELVIAGYSI